MTNVARRCAASCQPTTMQVARSMTVARHTPLAGVQVSDVPDQTLRRGDGGDVAFQQIRGRQRVPAGRVVRW